MLPLNQTGGNLSAGSARTQRSARETGHPPPRRKAFHMLLGRRPLKQEMQNSEGILHVSWQELPKVLLVPKTSYVTSLVVLMGEGVQILVGSHVVLKKKFPLTQVESSFITEQLKGLWRCRAGNMPLHSVFCPVSISQSLEPRGLLSLLLSVGSLSVSGNICLSPAGHCAPPPWQHLNHISKYLIQHSEKTDSGWFPVYQWARYFFQVNARTCMCAHTTIMLKRLKRSVGYCRIHYFNTALILTCSLEQSNKYKHRLTSYIGSNVHLSSLHVLLNLRIHK